MSRVSNHAVLAAVILAPVALPGSALACACGCGVFDVANNPAMMTGGNGSIFFEYDFMNQNKNWAGDHSAPSELNPDKRIRTSFYTVGGQYQVAPDWGVTLEVPYWTRYFKTEDEDTGNLDQFNHGAFGDVRIRGTYAGFSDDMSTGITFGVKLPTGDFSYPGFDRDTAIGTGSTDLLLGAYHMGNITQDYAWNWFANIQWDKPLLFQAGYRPGAEINASIGASYDNWNVGKATVAPTLQFIASYRWRDAGPEANPDGSGYERLMIAPGFRVTVEQFQVSGTVALPVYQHVNGTQLISPAMFKLNVSYSF
jgi:hypothetical protein